MKEEFKKELEQLINKHSLESKIDMPDFMMAEMICEYIEHLGYFHEQREKWFGKGYWDKEPLALDNRKEP